MFELAFERSMETGFDRKTSSETTIVLNQLLLSLLTSVRAYHDQRPQDLESFSNKGSPWRENAEKVFNKAFDDNLDYRIMEAVRNYGQHNRLPILKFTMESRRIESKEKDSSLRYTLDPEIDLTTLADSDKVRKKTREEIKAIGIEWVDLKAAIRSYISNIIAGHNEVRKMLFDELAVARRIYEKFVATYRNSNPSAASAPVVMAYADPPSPEAIYLGLDVVEEVERMIKLHPSATGLSRRYVSTEAVRQHPKYPSSTR